MQHKAKRAARTVRHRLTQRGGTFLGLVLGLIVGLAIAVVVALYITKSPAPFQQKGGNGAKPPSATEPGNVASALPSPTQQPQQGTEPSDPNRPLWSKTPAKPVGPAEQPAAPAQPPVATTRPADVPGATNGASNGAATTKPADKLAEKPAARPAEKPVADPIAEIAQADANKVGYLLQVGAFRSQDDADRQKANLAMQGFEARVTDRDVNGIKMYRVRVGPFNRIEDMNRVRDRLQSSGFDASVIRFTKQ